MKTTDTVLEKSLTKHAKIRIQQRGIPLQVLQLIEQFGKQSQQNRGVQIYLTRIARQNILREVGRSTYAKIEKHLNAYFIECDGRIVTVGHCYKKVRNY